MPATPSVAPTAATSTPVTRLLERLLADPGRAAQVTHVQHVPARPGRLAPWPRWVPDAVRERLAAAGVTAPWEHQAEAADLAWSGRHVVVATGTASGKSLAYWLPVLADVLDGSRSACALYVAPTKALAGDQLRSIQALRLPDVRAAAYDGDTPVEERDWIRRHANVVLTNPDMLHHSLLPGHAQFAAFLRRLRYVIVDECHGYRGVFGSHVAQVLRRLRRICVAHGAEPVFVLASATVSDPAASAARLTGVDVSAVTEDASPRGPLTFLLCEPPLTSPSGRGAVPVRRPATAEAADLLADLVVEGASALAFVRSRRAAESVALAARRAVAHLGLDEQVAAYRGGYLAEERRSVEARLVSGALRGVATTNALELGVNLTGLDAVVLAGFPGTIASVWQQAGRAGRAGQEALAVFVARDDPLDTYLVHHPDAVFGRPVEATVLDPANPHVLAPHLLCAAAERPLTDTDRGVFGEASGPVLNDLVRRGQLRRRAGGWFWTRRERPSGLVDLRGGAPPVRVVEDGTGRLLGTVDADSADATVHPGAVHLHQGETYLVVDLDLEQAVALVVRADPDYATTARSVTALRVLAEERHRPLGPATLHFGQVEVSSQVTSFLRRRVATGEVLGEEPLDLPVRTLRTAAVWYAVPDQVLAASGLAPADVPGAAHAAEHAAIGLLPLLATCDRSDLGGVSTPRHVDTGLASVFVYDGHPGGAGFAERGYQRAEHWLTATRDAVTACSCETGCPSCVQSPKCGSGNHPLDKAGALTMLNTLLGACGGQR